MDDVLLKYFLGELDDSERLQLLKQINSDESLKEEYIRLQNIFALTISPSMKEIKSRLERVFDGFFAGLRLNVKGNV